MRWWKAVGLAGIVGVAATGAVIAREERRRRAYTPDEVRARLHARAETQAAGSPEGDPPPALSGEGRPAAPHGLSAAVVRARAWRRRVRRTLKAARRRRSAG